MKKAHGKGRLLKNMQEIIILDANAILRYILLDIPEQAYITKEILLKERVWILSEVIAEVVYVMNKYLKNTARQSFIINTAIFRRRRLRKLSFDFCA